MRILDCGEAGQVKMYEIYTRETRERKEPEFTEFYCVGNGNGPVVRFYEPYELTDQQMAEIARSAHETYIKWRSNESEQRKG